VLGVVPQINTTCGRGTQLRNANWVFARCVNCILKANGNEILSATHWRSSIRERSKSSRGDNDPRHVRLILVEENCSNRSRHADAAVIMRQISLAPERSGLACSPSRLVALLASTHYPLWLGTHTYFFSSGHFASHRWWHCESQGTYIHSTYQGYKDNLFSKLGDSQVARWYGSYDVSAHIVNLVLFRSVEPVPIVYLKTHTASSFWSTTHSLQ